MISRRLRRPAGGFRSWRWHTRKPYFGGPLLAIFAAALALAGCAAIPLNPQKSARQSSFQFDYLMKGDVDRVAEMHQQTAFKSLRLLTEKLYRRNPREWKKNAPSLEAAVSRLFDSRTNWDFPELGGKQGTDCLMLAFKEDFQGDRVEAYSVGLITMILASYNNQRKFYLFDELDPQKLYNSARNVEIAAWKLGTARTSKGEWFLLSNEASGPVRNLSFERELGKLIAGQDILAEIVADKSNRAISHAVQSLATAVFLPI